MIQLSTNANEAKVYRARAAPLVLCENSVNALELLANQQKDGDSPIESIVTGLHEKSRKGIMDGLKNFIGVDKRSAVEVRGLRRRTRSLRVRKPQFSVAFPEAAIREGADELTLRAEEVGSLRTFIDTTHIELGRWGPSAGGGGLARILSSQSPKESKDKSGKRCACCHYKKVAPGGGNQATGRQSKGKGPLHNESCKGQRR